MSCDGDGSASGVSGGCDKGLRYDHTAVVTLALDTTTRSGSVALTRDDELLAVVGGDASRTHGERLPGDVSRVVFEAGLTLHDVELLAVARGPGAFTGLRIGLAAVQGLAMVLDRPVVGVSALDAIADAVWPSRWPGATVVIWMDAQRGEVFSAQYVSSTDDPARWAAVAAPVAEPPARILASLAPAPQKGVLFAGDGALRYRQEIQAVGGTVAAPPTALAPAIARLGHRLARLGHAGPPHALQPLYIRRPDAEIERGRRPTS